MIKYFCFFLFSLHLFSQDANIPTQFFQDGNFYRNLNENLNELSNPIGPFLEGEACVVIQFLGRDNYKIKYKGKVGIVKVDDLEVTEAMTDLYYAYQKKEREELIEAEAKRKENIYQIVHKEEIEKRKQDSIAQSIATQKALEEKRIMEAQAAKLANERALAAQRKHDSIAEQKALEAKRIKKANAQRLIEAQALEEKRIQDSIAIRIANEKAIQVQQKKQDSIAQHLALQKELEAKRIKEANEKYAENQRALEAKRIQDSIDLRIANEKALKQKRINDSISAIVAAKRTFEAKQKIKEENAQYIAKQKQIEAQRIKDSIALHDANKRALEQKRMADSLARIPKSSVSQNKKPVIATTTSLETQKALYEKRIKDSIIRSMAAQKALYEKRIKDSIIRSLSGQKIPQIANSEIAHKASAKEKLRLERIKFKDSCRYVMNDFDPFYNVRTVRTEAYPLSDNLTVELYRQGLKINVFFNSKEDLGCVSYFSHNRSSVTVTLENGKYISFYHSWDMECGQFSFKGNLSKSQMALLKESPVKSVKLKGTKGTAEITDIDYDAFFMHKLHCLD
ncbi:hypothetical protein [Tamlana sp. I1]|uniref:hypothetical protein n=1 Tax=Tamlana sp. I1 TaxID=2762061 RepID=UPI00188E175F|nr:hypothetical protein [Tamlana sp. I1]